MAHFVLVPGAGGSAWYWSRLVPELRARGHDALAVDLPAADPAAGLAEYTDVVVAAMDAAGLTGADRPRVVLVAQSMGGLTGPLVCRRVPVDLLVMLNAMTPRPRESGGEWWTVTGHDEARLEQARRGGWDVADLTDAFFHDVPPDVVAEAMAAGEPDQSGTPFTTPWPDLDLQALPVRFLQARDDRFFPLEFQRRIVRERLGMDLDEMPGGHLVALSRPADLADRLTAYAVENDFVGSTSAKSIP